MNFRRALALALSLLLAVLILAACNTGGNGDDTSGDESQDVVIKVSIKVKNNDGEVVYDASDYTYSGKDAPNVLELLEDYFYMENDSESIETDEYNDLVSIGSITRGEEAGTDEAGAETVIGSTYWWWKLNGREASTAMDEYIVADGDELEFYLAVSIQKS